MATTRVPPLDTTPVDRAAAAAIETAEARAWRDIYAAAPRGWAATAGVGSRDVGGALVLHWAATGRRYFNRAIGLGVTGAATEEAIDTALALWERLGIDMCLLQSMPQCEPEEYERWLRARGLEPFDAQDRIVRADAPVAVPLRLDGRDLRVERVTRDTAEEWSSFLQRVYRLDTGQWLPRLIGRPGWHQYVAREDGEVVAARGMYVGPGGMAWLGMDAPVPGLMTDDHEPDAALCEYMVADGLARGARFFLADIEAPSPAMDTPAYEHFGRLGFRRPYVRTHWARV
jgi:hypothetical protein